MLRFNFRIRVKPRRRKCARRCEKIPRHPLPMATTPLGCQESAPLKRSCPVMARPNQLSQSILPRGEKIGLASNLPFEGRDMKKAQRKVILYDAKDAREIPTSTLLDQLGVKRDKRGKVKCPLTCPRFCTTASERVYITARGCETGLGSQGATGRRYRRPVAPSRVRPYCIGLLSPYSRNYLRGGAGTWPVGLKEVNGRPAAARTATVQTKALQHHPRGLYTPLGDSVLPFQRTYCGTP